MPVRDLLKLSLLAIALLALAGCIPSARRPIETVCFSPAAGERNRCLFVFLPGKGDRPDSFEAEGFVAAVRKSKLPVDMIGAYAHMGYYMEKTFPERFREDVIAPARRKGYEQIWLVGISLGGLGALWYDGKYPGDVSGLVALAPYLGEQDISREVLLAGGLASWEPGPVAANDLQRQIWRGMKTFVPREKTFARVYLGYGLQDRFAFPDGVFAKVLPGGQVFTAEGGHDWSTWRKLWSRILDNFVQKNNFAAVTRASRKKQGLTKIFRIFGTK
jgi:pimeloyl-ACP methyl ester carboxylesterase